MPEPRWDVVSSLVSFVYVRLDSLVFKSMRLSRSRTSTVFSGLLSRVLKIGRSAVSDWRVTKDRNLIESYQAVPDDQVRVC